MSTTHYQHTRAAVLLESNYSQLGRSSQAQSIELSKDVISISTSKGTKTRGRFQIHLVPRKNYINLIFPDDVINIYLDPGDGKRGFIRTCFGYVDRVERQESTDSTGAMTTRYVIIGTDFQKAIDRTSIYFNPYLRSCLDERLVRTSTGTGLIASNNGGMALQQMGVSMYGTPADFVENLLQILIGFRQQWQLPTSYPPLRDLSIVRKDRVQKAKSKLPGAVVSACAALGFDPEQLAAKTDEILANAASLKYTSTLLSIQFGSIVNLKAQQDAMNAAATLTQNSALLALRTLVMASSDPTLPMGLHDLLNFDLVEAAAIDGWRHSGTVIQSSGQTLAQCLYGNCNAIVNELIFDLRPVTVDGGISNNAYSKEPDEYGVNTNGTTLFTKSVDAVKYVPSVVFREYPYSTSESIDLSSVYIIPPSEKDNTQGITTGRINFGPVFSLNPNVPGRHTYEYDNILCPDPSKFEKGTQAKKHIDVVVITNDDVISSALGRSDEEVINVFQLYPRTPGKSTEYWRGLMSNFQPIANPISIGRDGIRVAEDSTDFAFYSEATDGKVLPERNIARWALLRDHWYQHNNEYLSGTINLRGMPEIRVGYRLDWKDKSESYYVDSVSHQWQYPGTLMTSVEVSRGQRNDPFPVYIPPVFLNPNEEIMRTSSGDRSADGRLSKMFCLKDTNATICATDRAEVNTETGPNELDAQYKEVDANAIPATVVANFMKIMSHITGRSEDGE